MTDSNVPSAPQAPSPVAPSPEAPKKSALAVTAIALAAVALITAFIPGLTLITWLPGLAALVLGIIALVKKQLTGLSITAIVVGPIAIVIAIVMGIVYAAAAINAGLDAVKGGSGGATGGAASQAATSSAYDGEYGVKIVSATVSKDYKGESVLVVNYEFTNNSDSPKSFLFSLDAEAYQGGIGLDDFVIDVDGLDTSTASADIKPGTTVTVQQGYKLRDDSTVTVEVTELISFDDTVLATQDFEVK